MKKRYIGTQLRAWLTTRHKKPLRTQIGEVIRLWCLDRRFPGYYFHHRLYAGDMRVDVTRYLPVGHVRSYRHDINPAAAKSNTLDKSRYSEIMVAAGLPVIPNLYFIEEGRRILDPAGREVSYNQFVADVCHLHTDIFIKPTHGCEGDSAQKMAGRDGRLWWIEEALDERRFFEIVFWQSRYRRFLVQPVVQQHELLQAMNAASVNTVRMDALVGEDDVIRSSGAFLRVGNGDRWVDNVSAGGFHFQVNVRTGDIDPQGYRHVKFGRECIRTHPLSGFDFADTVLPFWNQVPDLIRRGTRALAPLRYIGWDIAFTSEGPVLVEASAVHDIFILQSAVSGLRYTPVGQAALAARGMNH